MRWAGFILRLILLTALVVWLTNQPGTARIVWHDYVIETSAAILALGVLAVAAAFFMLFRLWRFLRDGPRFWRLHQKLKKIQKGQEKLTQGLIAIASGDGDEASDLALSARKLLGVTPATRLLQAQAAQLAGDHRAAHEIFVSLAAEPESTALGYRGLIMAAVRSSNWPEAENYIEKLRRIRPETPWLNVLLLEIHTRRQQWDEARKALSLATTSHLIEKPRSNKYMAALMLASAVTAQSQGNHERALSFAEQAVKLAPGWLPALLTLASQQALTGHTRSALRLIERNWNKQPHPELARLYSTLTKNHDDPLVVYKQMERLTRETADNTISQLAMAEAALAADLWGAARKHLLSIASRQDATQIVFRLLAKLERRETGDERAAAKWLLRSSDALPDPRWMCSNCGGGSEKWQAQCPHCSTFNALEWQIPGISRSNTASHLQSLALLSE